MSTQQIVIIVVVVAVIVTLLAMRSGGPRITQIDRTVERKDDDDA